MFEEMSKGPTDVPKGHPPKKSLSDVCKRTKTQLTLIMITSYLNFVCTVLKIHLLEYTEKILVTLTNCSYLFNKFLIL